MKYILDKFGIKKEDYIKNRDSHWLKCFIDEFGITITQLEENYTQFRIKTL